MIMYTACRLMSLQMRCLSQWGMMMNVFLLSLLAHCYGGAHYPDEQNLGSADSLRGVIHFGGLVEAALSLHGKRTSMRTQGCPLRIRGGGSSL